MHRFVVAYLMVTALISATVAQSSHAAKPIAPALELAVTTDRKTYTMSDTVRMEARLLNRGNADLYIWDSDLCWNPARGLSMYVTTPEGKPVQPRFLFDCLPPPPVEGKANGFIKLEPGRLYGTADVFKISDVINKPGVYDIRVTFKSFISRSFINEFLSRDPISTLRSGRWSSRPSPLLLYVSSLRVKENCLGSAICWDFCAGLTSPFH